MSRTAPRTSFPAPRAKTNPHGLQDLLVHQEDKPSSRNALAYAAAMASAVDGDLTGLMFGFMATYPASIYMEATPDIWLAAQRKADAESAVVEAKIREQFASTTPKPEFRRVNVMGGEAGQTLAAQARYADAAVIGIDAGGPSDLQRQLFEAALFDSGRPVIVVPEGFRRHRAPAKIMVAWRPGREAARAVNDALPLLKGADEVRLVVVDESRSRLQEPEPGVDIARHLSRHDVRVDVKHIPGSGGTTGSLLLDEARYFGADMVVMGGYGHSRMREWILGGATRDLLGDTQTPLLVSH
jgi:nucleotide-binding universal stress UspA family protein